MASRETPRRCKDCVEDGIKGRSAPHPGPRCSTHDKKFRRSAKTRDHGTYLVRTYKMTLEEYDELYRLQGGVCAWCQAATGKSRRLSVDHDHRCCKVPPTCGECTRGLLCRPCNNDLGRFGDNPERVRRGAAYLEDPPARRVKDDWTARNDH